MKRVCLTFPQPTIPNTPLASFLLSNSVLLNVFNVLSPSTDYTETFLFFTKQQSKYFENIFRAELRLLFVFLQIWRQGRIHGVHEQICGKRVCKYADIFS